MSDERLHDDGLASAYLDGEATPAEIAEVEASDVLLARVEELRAVRDAVAEPVVPLSAEQRDDVIGAALDMADAEDAARLEAKVVPLQRPQRLLLAMAAAVIVLAAVVGTGLIASRGGDESADFAAEAAAPAADDAPADIAEDSAMAEEEPMPEMDMAAADEAMAEEFMAEEEPAEEAALDMAAAEAQAGVADAEADAIADELARLAAEEAAAAAALADVEAAEDALAAPTTTVATATTTAAAEADGGDDSPTAQVVDLGALESLESLFEDIGASWSAALEDGAMADSGACAAAVQQQSLELSAETVRSFVATVGDEDPVPIDAGFARRDDGTAVIVYAAPPDCEVGVHELSAP